MNLALLPGLLALLGSGGEPDADRDGLTDFHELHKYFTDPKKADSDGDGIPDGDWDERREFSYSVRAVMHVMAPFDVASMSDDYQDVRVLERRPDLLEFEVVVYPFNTVAAAIVPERGWRKPTAARKALLAPGACGNWDKELQAELLAGLAQDGIELDALDDAEAARRVAAWLLERTTVEDSFTTFALEFEQGRPRVSERRRADVERDLAKRGRTLAEQLEHELYGKGMFRTRTRGSCTSSAIYLATGLEAAGLPTRTVVCVPIVDANDEREVGWIETGLTHSAVRRTLAASAQELRGSWASHTFNEVLVGGRWRRLNYANLGQNVLDREYLGLMVHVHTFEDHSEAGLVGWGNRLAHPRHAALFGGPNPYSCISLSDRFGAHSKVVDEPAEGVRELEIGRLYWFADPARDPLVSMQLDDPEYPGHLLAHVTNPIEGDASAYREFYEGVAKEFVLRAAGQADVRVRAERGYWVKREKELLEFYLRLEPEELARMQPGLEYELVWTGGPGPFSWKVRDGTTLVRARR